MRNYLIILTSILCVASPAAWAETRLALIVGNGAYTSVGRLDNTVPDAALMAATLESHGFQVTTLTDAGQADLNTGISQFGRDLRAAGPDATGLFYYAGHAVQSFGTNYLLPTDAALTNAADLSLVAVPADAILRQMQSARNKTNIVILDACRNNPFANIRDLDDNGLAEMNAPTGTFLSYSTAPGAVALDGLDGNSPFTKALAQEIPDVGVPIEQVFKKVRVSVIAETEGKQTPWDTSSLTSEFVFAPAIPLTSEEVQEQQLWNSVRGSADPVQVMLFLRGYPNGRFQEDARTLLNDLMAAELAPKPDAPFVDAPAVAAPIQTPTATEDEMIAVAQSTGMAVDYQAYLDAFPQGVFAELAAFELEVLAQKATEVVSGPVAEEPVETAALNRALVAQAGNEVLGLTFTSPFPTGGPPFEGLSIEEIVKLAPLFPPIEGLPEELWKSGTCASCHSWTKEALCMQGQTYVAATDDSTVSKPHPFGGVFKRGLKGWAAADCP
jgi:hypothetical protein